MYKYAVAVLVLLAVVSAKSTNNPFGVVEGVVSCGSGAGQIRQVRVTDCTSVPCEVVVGTTYVFEIDFTPSLSHLQMHTKIILIDNRGSTTIIDEDVPNSGVEAGVTYTFKYNMAVSGGFLGFGDIRIEITGTAGLMEICGTAGINVVD